MSYVSIGSRSWRLSAAEKQNAIYQLIGDRHYDLIERSKPEISLLKISKALFNKDYDKCNASECGTVDKTLSKISEISGGWSQIYIGYVFICIRRKDNNEDFIVPLIRTKKMYSDKVYFVEPQPGRIYDSWNDFVKNNRLPECTMCFPKGGYYSNADRKDNGILGLEYRMSPSCDKGFKILDVVSSIGNLASSGVLLASAFFPLTLPITIVSGAVFGGTAIYSTARGIDNLVDLATHDESIALDNPEALTTWVSIASNVVGASMVGGSAIIPRLAATNRTLASLSETTIQILKVISTTVNAFGFVSGIASLIAKCRDGKLGYSDIQQFVSTCLFFGNIIINMSIAERLIRTLSSQPSLLSRAFCMVKNTGFEVSKSIIDGILRGFTFVTELILGGYVTPILEYLGFRFTASSVKVLITAIKNFKCNRINEVDLFRCLFNELFNHFGKFIMEIETAVESMTNFFGVPLKNLTMNGRPLYKNMSMRSPRIDALEIENNVEEIVKTLGTNHHEFKATCGNKIREPVTELASLTNCFDAKDFKENFSFLTQKIVADIKKELIVAKANDPSGLSDFPRQFIFDIVIRNIKTRNVMDELKREYDKTKRNIRREEFDRPLHVWAGGEMYPFDVNYKFWEFNNFICDAACELLELDCEQLFDNANKFGLHEFNNLFFVLCGSSFIVFYWEPDRDMERAVGLIMVHRMSAEETLTAEA